MNLLKKLFKLGRDIDYDHAIDCYNKNLYRESIELFGKVLQKKSPASGLYRNLAHVYIGQAHRNLGIMLFAMGNFQTALQHLQESLRFNPDYLEVYHLIGICQNNIGDFSGAVATFNSILKLDPVNLPIKLKLGVSLHNLKMWDKAVATYTAILTQQPRYADVHFRLGLALLGQGKPDEAIQAFQKALLINPQYIEARIKLGITQAYCGRFDDALQTFTAIIEKFPDYADVYYYLGIVHAGRGALPQAIAVFKKALSINPSYKDARIKLGILYCHSAAYDQALDQFQKASQIDPTDENLATLLETITTILATPRFSEDEISAALNQCFCGDKPIAQAIQEFNRHIKIMPDFSDILSLMQHFPDDDASLCSMLVPLLTDYLTQYPNYPDLHNALGTLFMKLKKYADAETAFRTAFGLNPSYMNAQINLLEALRLQGKSAEALEQGSALLTQHPNRLYPDVCCTIAELQLSAGKDEEAQKCISMALRINPQYCYAHYLQGKLYEQQNNTSKARQSYRQCLACKPTPEIAQEVERRLTHLFDT